MYRRAAVYQAACLVLIVLTVMAACGGSGSNGDDLCSGLDDRYTFEVVVGLDLEARGEDMAADDQYGPEPFEFEAVTVGMHDHGNFDVEIESLGSTAPQRIITVDGTFWSEAGGVWTSQEIDPGLPAPVSFHPAKVCAGLENLALGDTEAVPDSVDGQPALRYDIGSAAIQMSAVLWGPASDMARIIQEYDGSVWTTEDGQTLLGVALAGAGAFPNGRELTATVQMEVSDLGDPDIRVTPPS